jgi:hypothetical protein
MESGTLEVSMVGRSENVESRLSMEFSDFLGSEERAAEVVEGLRTGDEFHLSELEANQPPLESTPADGTAPVVAPVESGFSIDPPTDTMGYGNVRLTMKLTQANFERLGIDQPTNEQLSAMLVGGEIDGVQWEGILNERATGAGWGEIAKQYDFRVGELMGKAPSKAHPISVDQSASGDSATASAQNNGYIPSGKGHFGLNEGPRSLSRQNVKSHGKKANGYIPSGSSPLANAGGHGAGRATSSKGSGLKKNGYIPSAKSGATGAGIVAGHGASPSRVGNSGNGHAQGHSKGYVPSGTSAGVVSANAMSTGAAVSSANGKAHAKGHGKGHGKSK